MLNVKENMPSEQYIFSLGKYFGELEITALLSELDVQETPKIPNGDVDAYIKNYDGGVELTFTDERALDVKAGREYPEGVLVLSNIRFYGAPTNDFKIFNGALPMNLSFGDIKEKLLEKLMSPAWLNSKQSSMRWDFEGYCLFCDFDADQKLETICIQLPLQ